ncbi:hypothetical protein VTO42DRAFT_1705 [Malbranchea cinnamomea]
MASSSALPASFDSLYSSPLSTQYDSLRFTESDCLLILQCPLAQRLFGHDIDPKSRALSDLSSGAVTFAEFIQQNTRDALLGSSQDENPVTRSRLLHIAYASLCAFCQANITGPPLPARVTEYVIPSSLREDKSNLRSLRDRMIRALSVDGEAAYKLIPFVELFVVAKGILDCAELFAEKHETTLLLPRMARMRVNFLHQKFLSENTETLQKAIYADVNAIAASMLGEGSPASATEKVKFLLERAAIHTHHGLDEKARRDLEDAAELNGFEFALTGRLGKRTKFQTQDISQLVVLAKSKEDGEEKQKSEQDKEKPKPTKLDLNDDTLLESISFTKEDKKEKSTTVQEESSLPASLASLDPSEQPKLNTLDSITLLSIASAITNTSPEHGLTREETLPYATRVLDSGSSNWQVYSQALLVRSRIESYKSRTVERSVLQLQALVDQVIADTASSEATDNADEKPTTFLPRPQASESAPSEERIEYLWYINFPTRWKLEAELAERWVSLGGLRTALEIFERLHMWAEAALCYAATDREEKARIMVRKQLYRPTNPDREDENDTYEGPELDVLPVDAPRLFCILGDIDSDITMYERAWAVSNERYARAQRSLARHYASRKPPEFKKAEEAYKKSLAINRLNHQAWFALGCIQLELEKWQGAVESFTRTVQLEESDAQAWSNLAAALIHLPPPSTPEGEEAPRPANDEEGDATAPERADPYKHKRDALAALHRAAHYKHDDARIWDNILTVATSIPPPHTPFRDVLFSCRRIIELRGPKKGEKSIDADVFSALVNTLETDFTLSDPEITNPETKTLRPGTLPAGIIKLVDETIVPLITHSARLWLLVARVERWRERPSRALLAHEKAWRAAVAKHSHAAFDMGEEKAWMEIVSATDVLVRKGYAVFGGMEKEKPEGQEGAGAGDEELVAKDWRFKARSAVRGILGKGKELWEGSAGWERLKELAADVSGSN